MKRIADTRTDIETLDEAKEALREIALATKQVEKIKAAFEDRVAKMKANNDLLSEVPRKTIEATSKRLAKWITANPKSFQAPRKVKTPFGSFGMQTATELRVLDEEAALAALLEAGWDGCYNATTTLAKGPLKLALKEQAEARELRSKLGAEEFARKHPEIAASGIADQNIEGVRIVTGDTAVYTVAKIIPEDADETTEPGGGK